MQPLGQHTIVIAATILTFITSTQSSIRNEMLSLLLCIRHNGASYISFSPARANYYRQTLRWRVHLLHHQQSLHCSLTSGYSHPESFLPKQILLEPFGSGERRGLTPAPRDAPEGEVYGGVNYPLRRQLKTEGLPNSTHYAVGNW